MLKLVIPKMKRTRNLERFVKELEIWKRILNNDSETEFFKALEKYDFVAFRGDGSIGFYPNETHHYFCKIGGFSYSKNWCLSLNMTEWLGVQTNQLFVMIQKSQKNVYKTYLDKKRNFQYI